VFAPASGAALDQAAAAYAGAGIEDWVVHFAEGAEGVELQCGARNFESHPRLWAKFLRDAAAAPDIGTDLAVRLVGADEGEAFGAAAASGFGLPAVFGEWLAPLAGRDHWRCFVGFDGDKAVATGALFARNGVGWLGIGATAPDYRGRAAQQAILAARINAARALGCGLLTTETGVPNAGEPGPSFKNIHRAGFAIAYTRPNLRPRR
jgi:GNAT superfamily N-acetyltransferase